MAFVEVKGTRPFKKFEEADIYSDEDNKVLQLIGMQYNRIEEAVRFNEKYQPIGKGTNNIAEKLANNDKLKKGFEFLKGALTVGVLGYAAINNVGITETLGNLISVIPGVGEGLSNIITSPGSNGIITQLFADSSLVNAIEKGIQDITAKKDVIKTFFIDKLPTKIKEKYFEIENEKAEKIIQLESEYETDREALESNRELYKRKSKEIIKEIFSKDKETDKGKEDIESILTNPNEQSKEDVKTNPWQLSQEQRLEQRRKNEMNQTKEVIKEKTKQQEDKDI